MGLIDDIVYGTKVFLLKKKKKKELKELENIEL
jgi:hypothetical protein